MIAVFSAALNTTFGSGSTKLAYLLRSWALLVSP